MIPVTRDLRNSSIEEPYLKFKMKYIEQAIFVNRHFLVLTLVGFFSLVFAPLRTSSTAFNENVDFINSLMLGVGVSGIICWIFAFKIRGQISGVVWRACHVLLNVCHLLSVLFFLFFFVAVGVKSDGSISSLACGVFLTLIIGVMLSMRYVCKN